MASTKSLFVGILLLSVICSSIAISFNGTSTDVPQTIKNDGSAASSTINVGLSSGTFDGVDIAFHVHIKINHNHVSELKVVLTNPDNDQIVILKGNVNPTCKGVNIDATFSKFAAVPHHNPFERCDTTVPPMIYGDVRAYDAKKFFPANGKLIDGAWTLSITDLNSGDGLEGTLVSWRLEISDDLDGDSVKNLEDNCPLIYNPTKLYKGVEYQGDENMNHIGNECECAYRNYHVPSGDIKICYYLDNWGKDGHHYKNLYKQRGDWVSLIMPNRYLGEFQPGDYSHRGTWLDCDCNSLTILP